MSRRRLFVERMEAVSRLRSFTAIEVRLLFLVGCPLPFVKCDETEDLRFGARGEDGIFLLRAPSNVRCEIFVWRANWEGDGKVQ